MRPYGSAGFQTAVSPGEELTLFDGTETPTAGLTSASFVRAPGPTQVPAPMLFTIHYAAGVPNATVLVQASNIDAEANYQTLKTSTNLQDDYYQDAGNFLFYRMKMSAYVSGGMPVGNVQR